ncbi:4-hydroxy-tetrahydrodipicolinate synthase [Terrimicrobium sacchariphilum]|uniref:4-hydroxy-tetrahydrodipicolinate synthase n=1 Tax=Terrimicrobium sacchariphilum TaxID=690879 RepID=A0A146G934_TERSA|nr:4-hydroxy-tetrahydrodipicolinate synthase [Terrimicrobium sacchariphilum]GAT33981.1 4-hydroxy-tetrahydrodipicolinate synthase [Terrimicrobium sacchariphilum]
MSFAGTYTALVTPFRDGAFDQAAFAALIEGQIRGGVEGIVPVGTTGESPTLDHDEHNAVIKAAVEIAKGRCKVIAGTGSNSTKEAIELTVEAERLGADAALLVAPYYNKPSQQGLYLHYKAIAEAVNIPLVLYSIPGRCGIEIAVETVVRLAKDFPNIVAIKEAGGSVERVSQLRQALPDSFEILSGDDSLTLPFLSAGAVGVISVASNIIPKEVGDLVRHWLAGRPGDAAAIHRQYYPIFKDLFIEPNPVPTKYALAELGQMTPEVRLPLCEMTEASKVRVKSTLTAVGIL